MTEVNVFTPLGNQEFKNYIIDLKKDNSTILPSHILDQSPYIEVFKPEINIQNKQFATRFEFGEYLFSIFKDYPRQALIKNERLWNWLSLFYIDQLIPTNAKGKKIVGEISRYAYNPHYTSFYRHLVACSWDIYSRYGEDSKLFLYTPMNKTSQLIWDLACRQNIISNRNLIKVVQILYWKDDGTGHGTIKRGSVTKSRPGNLTRLIAILNQLDTTYDFYGMNPEDIITLLPAEFDIWKNKVKRKPSEEEEKPHQLKIEAKSPREFFPEKIADVQPVRKYNVPSVMKVAIKSAMQPLKLSSQKPVKRPVILQDISLPDESMPDDTKDLLSTNLQETPVHDSNVETPPYCQNCGKKVPRAAMFCPKCGIKLGVAPVSSSTQIPKGPSERKPSQVDVQVREKMGTTLKREESVDNKDDVISPLTKTSVKKLPNEGEMKILRKFLKR